MRNYVVGLDLGQKRDYTALTVVERGSGPVFALRHLERVPLKSSYLTVVARTKEIVRMTSANGPTTLVMDATGVGVPVFDLLQSTGIDAVSVTITGGRRISEAGAVLQIPKRELIRNLVTAFESGRLKIASSLECSAELIEELLNFKVRLNKRTGGEKYEAQGKTIHDDLVLSVALACWPVSL
jgi:hypothetical protein